MSLRSHLRSHIHNVSCDSDSAHSVTLTSLMWLRAPTCALISVIISIVICDVSLIHAQLKVAPKTDTQTDPRDPQAPPQRTDNTASDARSQVESQADGQATLPRLRSPLEFSLGYLSHRADEASRDDFDSYLSGDGLLLDARYRISPREISQSRRGRVNKAAWGARMSYLTSRDQRSRTPTSQALSLGDPGSAVPTRAVAPPNASESLGWRHRVTLGVWGTWSSSSTQTFRASLGLRWSRGDHPPLSFSSAYEAWGCLDLRAEWVWASVIHRGDSCRGPAESGERALLGLALGRARLGAGWGVARWRDLIDAPLDAGGALGWVKVPLSAPLYLELSAWYPRRLRVVQSTQFDAAQAGRMFSVALRWTGEREAPEREAPRAPSRRGDQSPSSPHPGVPRPSPSSPSLGSPLSPFPSGPRSPSSSPPPSQSPSTPL